MHDPEPATLYVPTGQINVVEFVDPAGHWKPALHCPEHSALVRPTLSPKVPGGHNTQLRLPSTYMPTSHTTDDIDGLGDDDEVVENVEEGDTVAEPDDEVVVAGLLERENVVEPDGDAVTELEPLLVDDRDTVTDDDAVTDGDTVTDGDSVAVTEALADHEDVNDDVEVAVRDTVPDGDGDDV